MAYSKEFSFFSENRIEYVNQRTVDVFKSNIEKEDSITVANIDQEETDADFNFSKVTHQNITTSDVIYVPLWNKASWKGLFVIPANIMNSNPFVGLVFQNEEGLNIFSKWINENSQGKITIGIITGIDKKNPYWYRVIVGENLFNHGISESKEPTLIGLTCRLHTMEAKNDYTINLLKQVTSEFQEFNLIPALVKDLDSQNLRTDLSFSKASENIIIKDVSEIDEKDFFLHQAILPIDTPVNLTNEDRLIETLIREKQKKNNTQKNTH